MPRGGQAYMYIGHCANIVLVVTVGVTTYSQQRRKNALQYGTQRRHARSRCRTRCAIMIMHCISQLDCATSGHVAFHRSRKNIFSMLARRQLIRSCLRFVGLVHVDFFYLKYVSTVTAEMTARRRHGARVGTCPTTFP